MRSRFGTAVALGLAALPFVFCGISEKAGEKIAEKALERSTGGKVDIQSGGKSVTITTDKGESVVMSNAMPENWPTDVPVYPGATAEGGFGATNTGPAAATMVALKSSDEPAKVMDFYKKELPAQSWTIKTTMDTPPSGGMLVAEKGTRHVTVMVGRNDSEGTTSLVLTVSETAT